MNNESNFTSINPKDRDDAFDAAMLENIFLTGKPDDPTLFHSSTAR